MAAGYCVYIVSKKNEQWCTTGRNPGCTKRPTSRSPSLIAHHYHQVSSLLHLLADIETPNHVNHHTYGAIQHSQDCISIGWLRSIHPRLWLCIITLLCCTVIATDKMTEWGNNWVEPRGTNEFWYELKVVYTPHRIMQLGQRMVCQSLECRQLATQHW